MARDVLTAQHVEGAPMLVSRHALDIGGAWLLLETLSDALHLSPLWEQVYAYLSLRCEHGLSDEQIQRRFGVVGSVVPLACALARVWAQADAQKQSSR